MNIETAAQKWNVKEKTILDYIGKRYIIGISVQDDEIDLPDIPKPFIKKKPKTVNEMDKYICDALNNNGYVNYRILGTSKAVFKERLDALIDSERIREKKSGIQEYETTLNYTLAAAKDLNPNAMQKHIPLINITAEGQIGLINAKVKVL